MRSKGPNVLFLMETKLSVNEMISIRDELGYHSMLAVPSVRWSGGFGSPLERRYDGRYSDLFS